MNEIEIYRIKVRLLTRIGIVSCIIIRFALGIYRIIKPHDVLSMFDIVAAIVLIIMYLSLVRLIHFYGKKGQSKTTLIISNLITGYLLIALVFVIIICAKGMIETAVGP